jgi:hypothetical protein
MMHKIGPQFHEPADGFAATKPDLSGQSQEADTRWAEEQQVRGQWGLIFSG